MSVELLMVLFAVEMADWLVTGVPTVVAVVVVEELFGERAALAAWTWACASACACTFQASSISFSLSGSFMSKSAEN